MLSPQPQRNEYNIALAALSQQTMVTMASTLGLAPKLGSPKPIKVGAKKAKRMKNVRRKAPALIKINELPPRLSPVPGMSVSGHLPSGQSGSGGYPSPKQWHTGLFQQSVSSLKESHASPTQSHGSLGQSHGSLTNSHGSNLTQSHGSLTQSHGSFTQSHASLAPSSYSLLVSADTFPGLTDAAGGGGGSEDGGEEGDESVAGSVPTRNTPEPLHLLRFPLLGPTRQEALMFLKAKNSPSSQSPAFPRGRGSSELLTPVTVRVEPRIETRLEPRVEPQRTSVPQPPHAHLSIQRHNTVADLLPVPAHRAHAALPVPKRVASLPNIHHAARTSQHNGADHGIRLGISPRQAEIQAPGEKTIIPSKYGFHPRSQSATYKRLDRARQIIDDKIDKQIAAVVSKHSSLTGSSMSSGRDTMFSSRDTSRSSRDGGKSSANTAKRSEHRTEFSLIRVGSMTLGMRRERDPAPISTESPLADLAFNLDSEVYEAKLRELGSVCSSEQSAEMNYKVPPQTPEFMFRESERSELPDEEEGFAESSIESILSPLSAKRRIQVKLPLMLEEDDEEV